MVLKLLHDAQDELRGGGRRQVVRPAAAAAATRGRCVDALHDDALSAPRACPLCVELLDEVLGRGHEKGLGKGQGVKRVRRRPRALGARGESRKNW